MSINRKTESLISALAEAAGGKVSLAKELGVKATSTLDKWAAGEVPKYTNIEKLARLANWTVAEVFNHFVKIRDAKDSKAGAA